MQAVILAGGAGRRVYPLGLRTPKSMFVLVGKPLIQHVIEGLRQAGITDIIIVTGNRGDLIEERFGDGSDLGLRIRYVHQPHPLGRFHHTGSRQQRFQIPFQQNCGMFRQIERFAYHRM